MQHRARIRNQGFTLLEMMIAMALGAVVLAAAVQMFSKSLGATWLVSQRAEMQQDFRAASNMILKDASMAGSGMGNNIQIALPSGTGVVPVYGCDQTPKCYINGGAVAYPTQLVGGVNVPYMYGLMPGSKFGPIVNAAAGATDVLTVVNADTNFLLNCYSVSVTSATVVKFTLPAPLPVTCIVPAPLVAPQSVNDPVVGLTPGDVVEFQVTIGVGPGATSSTVLGEVSNVTQTSGTTWDVTFAAGDPLLMNQPTAAAGSLKQIVGGTGSGTRINVVSYYIDTTVANTPRLMRQTSGHPPMPLAENVAFLQFSYDLYNSNTGSVLPDQADGGASQNLTPNQITKINIKHMSISSALQGSGGYQGLDLQTSVSARDLTFKNDYPLSSP
ncbi:MAG TPA: prepilin-type N-terminal cleavage/methylation domain-containing protein [Terriglobales bacterium]|jgi:prepilin-type N-terminal cleavage/methylation domain-containing protein|nr:prepilin-type N-terminal cleavage/methylation domain-containing protein [Terriglobales bacterium]